MTEYQAHVLKMRAHAILHTQRDNSLGNKAWGAQSSTLLHELLVDLVKWAWGEAGRRGGGGISMEVEAHWSPATAEGGRQCWKLIGLCGKGGKGNESCSVFPQASCPRLQPAGGWGNHRMVSWRGTLILHASSFLPPFCSGSPTPSPLFHLSRVPLLAPYVLLCPTLLLSTTPSSTY